MTNARTLTVTVKRERNASTYTHPAPYRGRVSKLRLVLSEGQAEADRPHGHAGRPQPYLQHGEQQEAPNNLAAGAHPSSVIVPSRSEREADHPPSSFHSLLTLSARYQTPNFSFFTGDALCTRTGFPGPETPFPDRVRSRAAPPPARSDRGRRRISPVGGQSPGESSLVERAFKKGPEAWGSQGARSPAPESGAVQSSAASQVSAGKSRSLCFRDPFRLPLLSPPSSRASLPQIPSGTAQSISRPLAWSPSFVFVLTRGASTSPSVPRLSGRMIFSTTLLTVAVSPEKATLSDGLFPSGFLLPRRRPPPLPLSGSDSLSLQ